MIDNTTHLLFSESIRALKPGGILVYQGGFRYIVEQAVNQGLEIVQFEREIVDDVEYCVLERWDCVFQKPLENKKTGF